MHIQQLDSCLASITWCSQVISLQLGRGQTTAMAYVILSYACVLHHQADIFYTQKWGPNLAFGIWTSLKDSAGTAVSLLLRSLASWPRLVIHILHRYSMSCTWRSDSFAAACKQPSNGVKRDHEETIRRNKLANAGACLLFIAGLRLS